MLLEHLICKLNSSFTCHYSEYFTLQDILLSQQKVRRLNFLFSGKNISVQLFGHYPHLPKTWDYKIFPLTPAV